MRERREGVTRLPAAREPRTSSQPHQSHGAAGGGGKGPARPRAPKGGEGGGGEEASGQEEGRRDAVRHQRPPRPVVNAHLPRATGSAAERPDPLGRAAEVWPACDLPCLPAVVGAEDGGAGDADRSLVSENNDEAVGVRRRAGRVEGGGVGGGGRG